MGLCTVGLDIRGDETVLAVRADGQDTVTSVPGLGRSDLLERVADAVPLRVGDGSTGLAEDLLAGVVRDAADRASMAHGTPDGVGLAVPVAWSDRQVRLMAERLVREVPGPVLVRRPEAAAAGTGTRHACVAVLLLGEDAVEAALVGTDAPRGAGLTIDGLAGRDLEHALVAHAGDAARRDGAAPGPRTRSAVRQALRALASRRSTDLELPGGTVRVHLADLEDRVGARAGRVLRRALRLLEEASGGVPLEVVLLAGDTADLPFLTAAVGGTFPSSVLVDAGRGTVARGAAHLAAAAAAARAVRS